MRRWMVGGALIRHADGLVLVGNRRRDSSLEWTPPGGVIDHGETLLEGLTREVFEETGLVVSKWSSRCYHVTVDAPDMGWQLTVEAWETDQVSGEICIADPDGIVEEVRYSNAIDALELLTASPMWVRLPVSAWLGGDLEPHYRFALRGKDRATAQIDRV